MQAGRRSAPPRIRWGPLDPHGLHGAGRGAQRWQGPASNPSMSTGMGQEYEHAGHGHVHGKGLELELELDYLKTS